jgi:hypothetical protein
MKRRRRDGGSRGLIRTARVRIPTTPTEKYELFYLLIMLYNI